MSDADSATRRDVSTGSGLTRRRVVSATLGAVALSAASRRPEAQAQSPAAGALRQSVCRWCYARTDLATLAAEAKRIGLASVELLDPDEIATVRAAGLTCAMVNSHPLWNGLADPKHHEACLAAIRTGIDAAAEHGCPNVITFSGNRRGISEADGLEHSAQALAEIVPYAEQKGVTICMELLNSRVDHPDYMCDRTRWGVDLVERVASPRFKLLYDIYHMQIMEGDVIRTIRDHADAIGHYHTAGVPGRHELDEDQELYYPAIVRAIVETGYTGFLGQEFIPRPDADPFASLAHGVAVCTV
ncbi:MAG: hydroxypyruvate isomerase [Acidobacteria bacterium]|nr:MAG: hydroxypyruvate isomerase [Acidobacteriota bacterium]REK10519.1 MAG: hydroxypyruvate isomerase [Acidobacteriota bacterium]